METFGENQVQMVFVSQGFDLCSPNFSIGSLQVWDENCQQTSTASSLSPSRCSPSTCIVRRATIVSEGDVLIGAWIPIALGEAEVDDVDVTRFLLNSHPERGRAAGIGLRNRGLNI